MFYFYFSHLPLISISNTFIKWWRLLTDVHPFWCTIFVSFKELHVESKKMSFCWLIPRVCCQSCVPDNWGKGTKNATSIHCILFKWQLSCQCLHISSCSVIKSQFISSFAAYSRNSVVLPVLFKNYPMTSIYFSETRIASFSYLRCFDISNQMHEIVKQSVIVTSQLW